MTITRMDFVETITQKIGEAHPHISQGEVEKILGIFLDKFVKDLMAGHRIELRGLGVFATKMRKARTARNPKTKEAISVPPRRVITFKPSKVLKRTLNEGG